MIKTGLYERFYEVIRQIPTGCVATYGQIATLAGFPGYARQVGFALHANPEGVDIPWHRVINSKGKISLRSSGPYAQIQRSLLEAEGIEFDEVGKVLLKKYLWNPNL